MIDHGRHTTELGSCGQWVGRTFIPDYKWWYMFRPSNKVYLERLAFIPRDAEEMAAIEPEDANW